MASSTIGSKLHLQSRHKLPPNKPALNPIRWLLAVFAAYTAPSSVGRPIPWEVGFEVNSSSIPPRCLSGMCRLQQQQGDYQLSVSGRQPRAMATAYFFFSFEGHLYSSDKHFKRSFSCLVWDFC